MRVPSGIRKLGDFAQEITNICMTSQGTRAASYRTYGQWIEAGRASGGLALANLLYSHIDRLQSHLFSPTNLRFSIDFENKYPQATLDKGAVAARVLSRTWERANIDLMFAAGVQNALSYGSAIPKIICKSNQKTVDISASLVMPWNFGVYDEARNGLSVQEAMNEVVYISLPEAWRRIAHLPDAEKLYQRIKANASKNTGAGTPNDFPHQVLSTAVLDTSLSRQGTVPGGIVNVQGDVPPTSLSPQVAADLVQMNELWVWDDDREDYTTFQWIAPGILIAPRLKVSNLFCPDTLPYGLIQPNEVTGYFWGRSEIVDLMCLQELLSTTLDDIKRVMGQQFDKLLGFSGQNDITDETYAVFRASGWVNLGQNGDVKDVTPQLPQHALDFVNMIIRLMQMAAGFSNVLSGEGEAGVRSDAHAETLAKMASPRLRDRSLIVERNCNTLADATLAALEAKDARAYWVDPEDKNSEFVLADLPEDRRIMVDSHSSSPIYQDDHNNVVAFLAKAGAIDAASIIEMLDVPNKDLLLERLKAKEANQQQMFKELMQRDPEAAAKVMTGKK